MTTARHYAWCATAGLLCGLTPWMPAFAASTTVQASATVVLPASVNAWLGVPVSVEALLLAQNAAAGPATGALVPRVASGTTPAVLRALPLWIAAAVETRQPFGIDTVPAPGAALLASGPAAAVSVGAGGTGGDGEAPLVITVAFN